MKNIFVFFVLICSFRGFSQSGMYFLAQFPSSPKSICITDTATIDNYLSQLEIVTSQLDSLCALRKAALELRINKVKPDVEKNIAQEYGLSDADLQKLKNKKLSAAEKKALTDKMLREKANISMKEIEQLKKMKKEGNKEGIRNWAEAYQTQQISEMVSGDSTKTPEMIEFENNFAKNKEINDLMKEQKQILDRIAAVDKRITNKMIEFNKEDSIQTEILKQNIEPLEKMLTDDYLTNDQQQTIYMKIATNRLNYCNKISPMYMDIIKDLRASTEPLIPTYDRLEVVNAEINAKTMGLKEWPIDPGLMQLDAVRSLAHAIAGVFRYTIVPPKLD
ncbi:MAG TPA: hypothetical protein DHV28_12675 [Ignavibacteriales bacterium]|nr:hypothetical protein [Ignavibacteriales bacterium]